jgi:hypothetical protein
MPFFLCSSRLTVLPVFLFVLGLVSLPAGPSSFVAAAQAQSAPHDRAPQGADGERRGSSRLPEWAEPRARSSHSRPSGPPDANEPPSVQAKGLGDTPPNPDRVPLGGLEWLVVMGVGYGIVRLRRER